MSGWLREFRLIPVVLAATISLLALKTFGLIFDGGFTLGQRMNRDGALTVTTVPGVPTQQLRSPSRPLDIASEAPPKRSWMQEMFSYPSSGGAVGGGDVTGSIHTTKPAEKKAAEEAEAKKEQPKEPPPDKGGQVISMDQPRPASPAEKALLERLQARRQELDARARELDMREGMLKEQEKKVEGEAADERSAAKAGADAKRKKEDIENARFKALVAMYETMKPKDAAKIFDRLDIRVLLDMASQIKPQRMAEIMANMSPEAAERLTIEMAAKSGADRSLDPASLPKIDGKPGGT